MHGFNLFEGLSHKLHLPVHIIGAILVTIFLIALGSSTYLMIKNRKEKNPDKWFYPEEKLSFFTFIDILSDFIYGICVDILGKKDGEKYYGLIGSIFCFVLFSNLMGLIPGVTPPTDNLNTTLALGIFSFLYYNYVGLKEHGIHYYKQFMGPIWYLAWLIFPIEIVSHLFRPVTLGLRLWGNMMGDHAILTVFTQLTYVAVPVIFLFMGLFVCFLQAYVFSLLSMIYISLAKSHDH